MRNLIRWNFIKILLISLLVLGGCSQPPSNESSRQAAENNSTDKNITTRTVQVLVGLGGTQRSNQRPLGSYQDVTEVVLSYNDPDNVTTAVDMVSLNGIWSANITLSAFGSYEFQAIARNSSGTTIFESASPVSREVTAETIELELSLQMMAVEVDSTFVAPKITQLTIPQTYLPDTEVTVDFQVQAAPEDLLEFTLEVVDDTGTLINIVEDNSTTYTPDTTTSGNALYDGSMSIFVGTEPGPMTFTFTAYSVDNSYAVHARFTIQQANQSAAPVLQFMPTVEKFRIGSEKLLNVGADSSLIFDLKVADYGMDYSNEIKFMPDNTTIATTLDDSNGTKISGTFSRIEPNAAGSLSITFLQLTTQFSVTYDIPIPAGQTVFTEVGGTIGSCGSDCPVTPSVFAILTGIDGADVELQYHNNFEFAPQGTHDLTTDGSAEFLLDAWENGEGDGYYDVEITDGMGTVVWDNSDENEFYLPSDENEFFLPAGTYTIAFTAIGTINDGRARIRAFPVHVLDDAGGSMVVANYSIDGAITTSLGSYVSDLRNIYFNQQAGLLAIVQDQESDLLLLRLFQEDGTEVESTRGEMILGHGHTELSSGNYQLEIYNDTGADWNGRIVAYTTFGDSVVVTTPDGINFYGDESVYMEAPSSSALVVNQCTQEAREIDSDNPLFSEAWPITYASPCNDTSLYYDIDLSNLPAGENYLLDFSNYGYNASDRMLWIEDSTGTDLSEETGMGNSNGLVILAASSMSYFQYRLTGGEVYKWAIRNGTGDQSQTNTSLALSFQPEFSSDFVFGVDVSTQCLAGQYVRINSGDPQDLDGNSISSSDDDGNTIVTSADCSQPFQMVVSPEDYLDFYLDWSPIEVSGGVNTWSYDHPETWPVYEPLLPFFDGSGRFEIKWQEPTSGEVLYINNTDPDIELGVRNEETSETEWSGAGIDVGPIALDRTTYSIPDTSLLVFVRYVGTEDIEGAPLSKSLNIVFQDNVTMSNSSNYADEFNIQFEVRDND